ncbi:hypothetical protein [Marinicrinis lubricantis]|uniref:Uncharacterized protein n=1 Tax=Marinicrinis lubricantis TaxID=2086470 RepID=A0ABW1ILQ5_9BACL
MGIFIRKAKKSANIQVPESPILQEMADKVIDTQLKNTLELFSNVFQQDMDFSIRTFYLFRKVPAAAVFISSMVDKDQINQDILKPLQEKSQPRTKPVSLTPWLLDDVLYHYQGN